MIRLIRTPLISALMLMLIGFGSAATAPASPSRPRWRHADPRPGATLPFTATAYCQSGVTRSGVDTHSGIVAADPAELPVGSVVQVVKAGEVVAVKEKAALTEPEARTADEKDRMDRMNSSHEKLKSLSGADFDRTFLQSMVDGHRDAILTLTSAQAQLSSRDVKSLIQDVIPTLRRHQQDAEKLLQQ